MNKEITLRLYAINENNELLGKIEAFSIESLLEQLHKIEHIIKNYGDDKTTKKREVS